MLTAMNCGREFQGPLPLLAILLLSVASAKDKPTYPEHGTVVAMRTQGVTSGGGVYTGPNGKTHGGAVHTNNIPVFKIRTSAIDYEVEGKPNLSLDEEFDFRIEKLKLYIQRGEKEQRYSIVGEEKR
jgi:hypothetical protein